MPRRRSGFALSSTGEGHGRIDGLNRSSGDRLTTEVLSMALLFVLLTAWVVGAIVVLAFLSGAQRLGEADDSEAAHHLNALRPAQARSPALRRAGTPSAPRFRS